MNHTTACDVGYAAITISTLGEKNADTYLSMLGV